MTKIDANSILQAHGVDGLRDALDAARAHSGAAPDHGADIGAHASTPEADRSVRRSPLNFTMFDDLGKEARKDWLVDGLLGTGEASAFFGEPGSAKSVLSEDLGLHIAADRPWLGRTVRRGAVLFLALERAQLVKRRAIAFRLHHGLSNLPFAVVSEELDFRDIGTANRVASTAKAIEDKTGYPVVLIITDTVSRALCGGDENSPKDMGALVRTVERIRRLTDAHMLCNHHTPVDGSKPRLRGFGGLKGGLDTTIHVEKAGGIRTATVTKANDAEEGQTLAFTLLSVDIDRDENGNVTSAPVVIPASADASSSPRKPKPTRRLSDRQRSALDALSKCAADNGNPPPPAFGLPDGISAITIVEWREELFDTAVLDPKAKNPRADFSRLKESLRARRLIALRDGLVWRC